MSRGVFSPHSCKKTCSPSKSPPTPCQLVLLQEEGRGRPLQAAGGLRAGEGLQRESCHPEPHRDLPHLRDARTRRPGACGRERCCPLAPAVGAGLEARVDRPAGVLYPRGRRTRPPGRGPAWCPVSVGSDGDCVRTHSPSLGVAHAPHTRVPCSPLLWGPQYSRSKFFLGSVLYSPLKRGHPKYSKKLPTRSGSPHLAYIPESRPISCVADPRKN